MLKIFIFILFLATTRIKQITTLSRALLKRETTFFPPFVPKFEKRFSEYVGTRYGLTFCNGTSAIEAALFAIGVQPGDEIIVPSCTFHASIDPIVNAGATPVFVDVSETSLTANPEDIAQKISKNTKAIILVHLFGTPADVSTVRKMIGSKKIYIIEDSSHAHGAKIGDKCCGSFGDIGVFSLQGRKAVAAGEGGIAVTNNESLYLKMSLWGHFDRHAAEFDKIGAQAFKYTGYGFKRRMAPLSVLVADAEMNHLDWINSAMNHTVALLDSNLSSLSCFKPIVPFSDSTRGGFFYGYPIYVLNDKLMASEVISALARNGFEATVYPFQYHHKLKIYNNLSLREFASMASGVDPFMNSSSAVLPVTENLKDRLFFLPRKYLITLNSTRIKKLVKVLSELQ